MLTLNQTSASSNYAYLSTLTTNEDFYQESWANNVSSGSKAEIKKKKIVEEITVVEPRKTFLLSSFIFKA